MQVAPGGPAEIQQLRSALLREGMTTYPLAMQAAAEFRREVFSLLERVAKQRATPIFQIFGSKALERSSNEVDDFLDGADTFLCIYTEGANYLMIWVAWENVNLSPDSVVISAGIGCSRRATFQKVTKALQDRFESKIKLNGDGEYECYLEKQIQKQQIDKLELELGKITDAWIRMLRAVNVKKLIGAKQ